MERSFECCVFFLRSQLRNLLLEEPQTFEDLHRLVQQLLTLQEQLNDLVRMAEDITNGNYINI